MAFLDPPKETAREAIAALREYGIDIKIITGDNEVVTRKICKEVGLLVDNPMLGKDVAALTDAELADAAVRTTIFTKMSPLEKSRVIRALQSRGHTVGYLGDGINDAAALKDADVGISVDTAVDIAKELADIILLEKSLLVLEPPLTTYSVRGASSSAYFGCRPPNERHTLFQSGQCRAAPLPPAHHCRRRDRRARQVACRNR